MSNLLTNIKKREMVMDRENLKIMSSPLFENKRMIMKRNGDTDLRLSITNKL